MALHDGPPPPLMKVLLPYEADQLTPELKEKAKRELFEDEETKKLKLEEFKQLLEDENIVFPKKDEFLLPFLRVRKYNVQKAVATVKNLFHVVRTYTDVLGKNPDLSAVWRLCSLNIGGFLPYRTYEGSGIHLIRAGLWNPNDFSSPVIMRALSMALIRDTLYEQSQVAGFVLLLDCEGFGLRHVMPVRYLKFMAEAVRDAFPGRLRGIHLINESFVADYFIAIVKKLLPKKLAERIHFHGTDREGLYRYIPQSILPQEYGGDLGPFDNTEWANSCRPFQHNLQLLCHYAYLNE